MPNSKTFQIKPIEQLLFRYIGMDKSVVDPFARDNKWATRSNDLNPETTAGSHLDAETFMELLSHEDDRYDVALLDPPYSSRQIMECYNGIGRKVTQYDTQMSPMLHTVKDHVDTILKPDGVVISFGWNSGGMGVKRGFDIVEILLVNHGGMHNDTIVTVERKNGFLYHTTPSDKERTT